MAPKASSSRSIGDERGAAIVEFALLVPLLFALLLGTVTGGLAYNRKLSITDAVREGARFGATLDVDGGDAGSLNDWTAAVQARTVDVSANELQANDVCVALARAGTSDLAASSCAFPAGRPSDPSGVIANTCLVKVWARETAEIEAIIYSQTVTLTGDALARYERTANGACS